MFCTWSHLFMQIWVERVLRPTNLSCEPNNLFHVRKSNFDQNLKFGTWIDKLKISCRIMEKHVSIKYEIYFMSFGWKFVNAIHSWLVGLMGVRWVKSFEVWKRMLWVEKESGSEWKSFLFKLRKFFSLENLDGMPKLWKFEARSSFLTKTQVCSHS